MERVSAPSTRLAEEAAPSTVTGVLRMPEVLPTITASIVARLSFGAMSLLTVLRVTDAGYSYGQAGLASAAFAVMMAIGTPTLSRLIDRDGQTRVLLISATTGAAATAAMALMPLDSPLWLFILVAAVNGVLQPPLGGTMRTLWDLLLESDQDRHVGYALEAAAVEVVFTGGPLLLVGVIASAFGADVALLVCAALTGGGTVAFALSGPSRRWRPSPDRIPDPFGPLRCPGVWTMLLISLGAGAYFGMVELSVTAFGRAHGDLSLIGLLLAVWSIGSFVGGMVIARVKPAANPPRRIVLFMLAMGLAAALLGVVDSTIALAVVLALTGAWIAPVFATANGLMGAVAPQGTLTEAFAWTTSAIMLGFTVGSPSAGYLVDHVSLHAAFAAASLPCLIAAALVWLFRGTLVPAEQTGPATKAEPAPAG